LYQIWLLPERTGLPPSYEQKAFDPAVRQNRWQLVASPNAAEGSLEIHQNALLYLANLAEGQKIERQIEAERSAWLQVLNGKVEVAGNELTAGDAMAITRENFFAVEAHEASELLLFDLGT
jgi:redox-sensitive bicupin YhaK (pirin superfamily)